MHNSPTQMSAEDLSKWAAGIFAVAASFLVWTALPGMHWHDTGEFSGVSWWLSISHPPGHPVHASLTHGVQRLFVGDLPFRANLCSGLLLAFTASGFFVLLRRVTPGIGRIAAASMSLLPIFLPAIWLQGVRAEVYALQLLLSVAIVWASLSVAQRDDHRALLGCALLYGLAGANHSLLGLMLVPFTLVAMFVGRSNLRSIAGACVTGLMGLSAYLYLPLRSDSGREVGWGVPNTLDRIWETISAREWSRSISVDGGGESGFDILTTLTGFVFEQFGLISMSICMLVLVMAVPILVRQRRMIAMAACGLVAIPFLFRLFYPPDLLNPDLGGYLALGLMALVALVCIALEVVVKARVWQAVIPGAILISTLSGFDHSGRSQSRSAERFARQIMAETPAGGILVYSDYASFFQGWCLRANLGERPDIRFVFRGQLRRPWFKERLSRHDEKLAARLHRFPEGFDGPEVRFEPGVKLEQIGNVRSRLVARGLTLGVGSSWLDTSGIESAFRVFATQDRDSVRNEAFFHAQHMEHLLHVSGPDSIAQWHLARLRELSPDDPWVVRLGERLGDGGQ